MIVDHKVLCTRRWDEGCLDAVASAMDDDGYAPDIFKEYLEFLEQEQYRGTADTRSCCVGWRAQG